MGENTEVYERDPEEQLDNDGEEGGGDGNVEQNDQQEDYNAKATGKYQSLGANKSHINIDNVEHEVKPNASVSEQGKTIRCSQSETINRLFIGNVPKSWTDEEFRKFIENVGLGVDTIDLIKDPQTPSRNLGFAFVLYYNNACANYSKQKMTSANFKMDGNTPRVLWAGPRSTPDHSAAGSQMKALYVKNIPENTSAEQLKEPFLCHGEVTKVVMPFGKSGKRDFGFIQYAESSSALKAVKDTEKYKIDGQVLEVVLAKPETVEKAEGAYYHGAEVHQSHLPHAGCGSFAGTAYGSVGAGLGVSAGFRQPMIYGRGPMPSGMHMVQMVLPDGRICYVLQQPEVQMPSLQPWMGPGGRGGSSGGDDGNRGT